MVTRSSQREDRPLRRRLCLLAKQQPLEGAKTYTLQVPPGVPAKDNWSVTIHDPQTRAMLQTIPGKSWFIILRMNIGAGAMVSALGPWLDKTWRSGELELAT